MKVFAIFDLGSDGLRAEECASLEDAFNRVENEKEFLGWVASEDQKAVLDTKPSNSLDTVKASEMRRHWWIAFNWDLVTTQADPEPVYIRGGIRPIEESDKAAKQFDTFFNNYQAVTGKK